MFLQGLKLPPEVTWRNCCPPDNCLTWHPTSLHPCLLHDLTLILSSLARNNSPFPLRHHSGTNTTRPQENTSTQHEQVAENKRKFYVLGYHNCSRRVILPKQNYKLYIKKATSSNIIQSTYCVVLKWLEGTACYAGFLLTPTESFGRGFFGPSSKKRAFYAVLFIFGV